MRRKFDFHTGTNLHTCLGDLYSVSWLEDADSAWNLRESLARQMAKVTKETKESHVQIFGDTSFASDFAGAFEGDAQDKKLEVAMLRGPVQNRKGVDARRATLSYYISKARAGLPGAREALAAEMVFRAETTARFEAIAAAHGTSTGLLYWDDDVVDVASFDDETWDCYKAAVDAVRLSCPRGINDEHVMDHLKILAGICAAAPASDVASTVRTVCA